MIRRFSQIVTGEIRGMHNAAYLLGGFTLLSSLLAFMRDRILAHTFGAGLSLDIYNAAFRLPDLIFVTVASLVSAYVLIPEFTRRQGKERVLYMETITAWFFILIALVGIIAFVLAPWILKLVFPELASGENGGTLLVMARIMLLQPIFLGFSNILATITQAQKRYVIFALSPLFYNLGIIIGVVVLYPFLGLTGLAWGVVIGAVMHVAVPLPTILRDGFFVRIPRLGSFSTFFRTIAISLPRTLALSANQIVLFALIAIAGTLSVGSITVFTFAFNLQAVPVAIIGISYSVAAFPALAALYAAGKRDEFVRQVRQAARHVIFWTIPMMGLVIVLRAHIVRVILGSGHFDWADTRLTAAAFALFACALTANALMPLLVRGYYATGRSWVPFIVNLVAACGAVALGYLWSHVFLQGGIVRDFLESLLRVSDVPGTEVLALPLAYAAGSIIGTLVLIVLFERTFGGFIKGVAKVTLEAIVAAAAGGAAVYTTLVLLGGLTDTTTLPLILLHGFLSGLIGLCAVIASYYFLGSQELFEMHQALQSRFVPKSRIFVSTEDELA
jgi:putative peptidoglycan lipid II flippase